jgi:hypothetical protein
MVPADAQMHNIEKGAAHEFCACMQGSALAEALKAPRARVPMVSRCTPVCRRAPWEIDTNQTTHYVEGDIASIRYKAAATAAYPAGSSNPSSTTTGEHRSHSRGCTANSPTRRL